MDLLVRRWHCQLYSTIRAKVGVVQDLGTLGIVDKILYTKNVGEIVLIIYYFNSPIYDIANQRMLYYIL